VERVSPAAQRAAAKRQERREAARDRGRARRAEAAEAAEAAAGYYPGNLRALMPVWAKLQAWDADLRGVTLRLRRRAASYSTGHAWNHRSSRIVVTAGTAEGDGYAVLLHEIAHHAGFSRRGPARIPGHGPDFYRLLMRAAEELLGHEIPLSAGMLSKRSHKVLAAAFQAEVDAGRLPGYGPEPKPVPSAPRSRRRRPMMVDPWPVPIPPELVEEIRDILDFMRIDPEDDAEEPEATLDAGAADWCQGILDEGYCRWTFFPVHPSAASMWDRIAWALACRAEATDSPALQKLADQIRTAAIRETIG
jgi:hypothetical protein